MIAVEPVAASSDVLANGSVMRMQQGQKMRPRCCEDTGKHVVEWRPPGFKKKLFLGTYKKKEDAQIACDVGTFHTEKREQLTDGRFYYSSSLQLFGNQPPLSIEFSSLKPDCEDGRHHDFSKEIRERAQFWIKHNTEFPWTERAHSVSNNSENASTSQTEGQQDYCQQTSTQLTDSFGGHGIPAVLEGNAHDALSSKRGAEKMPEAAPTDDFYKPDWSALSDLPIVRKYPELSNEHCNLSSHVTGYNGSNKMSGIATETEAVHLTTGTTHPAHAPAMTVTANEVCARGGRLLGFELSGQNLHISPTLDDPFDTERKLTLWHAVISNLCCSEAL